MFLRNPNRFCIQCHGFPFIPWRVHCCARKHYVFYNAFVKKVLRPVNPASHDEISFLPVEGNTWDYEHVVHVFSCFLVILFAPSVCEGQLKYYKNKFQKIKPCFSESSFHQAEELKHPFPFQKVG